MDFADRVLNNWVDDGHSPVTGGDLMERGYVFSALEGQIEGHWPRWEYPDDEVLREIMKAAFDHLADVMVPEKKPEIKPKKRRRRTP